MRITGCSLAVVLLVSVYAIAQDAAGPGPEVESVYAPPAPTRENEGTNEGGVNFLIDFRFLTDYVWRGIDRSESGGPEDSPNLLFDGKMTFDTGRYPHPFLGIVANVYDSDPLSRFQEIRPYFGLDWNLRPFLVTVGHANYIFPERDNFNTAEVFGKCTLDDSYFFRTDQPIASPYVFGAYDYDKGRGAYLECGISHDFVIEDTPVTITPGAHIAYVVGDHIFARPIGAVSDPAFDFSVHAPDNGFQHYQVDLVVTYGLNQTFNIPKRWGQFDLKGYLSYTDGIDNKLRADTQIWGGLGIAFSY